MQPQSSRGLFCLLGCGEEFSEYIVLGRFEVLWDGGKVGGEGEVAAECVVCMNSPEMTPEEVDAAIKHQGWQS